MQGTRLIELIERIGNLLRGEQRRTGQAEGLHPVHLQVLDYLGRCNRFSDTPMAVARYLGATKGTLSQSVALLERKGLVIKQPDSRDKRVVHLKVTPAGERLSAEAGIAPGALLHLQGIKGAEVAQAEAVLETLLRALQRVNGARAFGQCRTCRHLLSLGEEGNRCGLTGEGLGPEETEQICAEHEARAERCRSGP